MITGQIVKGRDLPDRFKALAPKVNSGVQKAVERLAIKMTGNVKNKLSGDVLKVRTGNLRRSVHYEKEFGQNKAFAIVGTNVIYARIHEYGGTIVPKTAKALKFKIGDRWVITKKVTIPERSFLRTALKELVPEIKATLEKAVGDELKGLHR